MKNQTPPPALKTQKSKDRYKLMISVGSDMFLKNGFENTSLCDIISKSGGSLSTIYKYFGSKEGLFKAIIDDGVKNIYEQINKKVSLDNSDDLENFLYKFSEEYLRVTLKDTTFLFKKLIMSEYLKKNSQICEIYYKNAVEATCNILVKFFEKPTIKSKFKNQNLELLAFRFVIILTEPFTTKRFIFNKKTYFTKLQKKEWIEECINFFLNGSFVKSD